MPIFEYRCAECNERFEVLHKSSAKVGEVSCPKCNSTNNKKLLSAFNSAADGAYSFADSKQKRQDVPAPSCACGSGGCD
ncbi:MAG: zinc ribbon domain-containing protein [Ignavibacteria bacterium]|nr:zinc ribbon domain-containing protein [Ignavibacteria bacterium]